MLSKKYLNSVKNLHAIMRKIIEGTAPEKFTTEHLKKIGFPSSNDRAILGLLKDLGFLTESGNPTQRYHDYRNASRSKQILGEALKEAYPEIFHINEQPSQADKAAITGLFKTTHNVNDTLAGFMSNTFFSLLDIADINGQSKPHKKDAEKGKKVEESAIDEKPAGEANNGIKAKEIITNLRYNIEIHLPATKDIEVYNSIFKSLRQHLLDE